MKPRSNLFARVLAALALLSPVARAFQSDVVSEQELLRLPQYAEPGNGWPSAATHGGDPRFRDQVLDRYRELLEAGHHAAVLQALADEFRAVPWPSHAEVKQTFQLHMDRVVEAFGAAVSARTEEGALTTDVQRSAVVDDLKARRLGAESLLPQKRKDVPAGPVVEEDDDAPERTVLVFFAAEPDEILCTAHVPGGIRLLVPPELQIDLRLRGDAFQAVFQHAIASLQDLGAESIRAADRAWQNYLFHGYSQYPWEALLNGWVVSYDVFDPPDEQWILLHPTIGVEASTVSLDEITADEVFNVELLGYLHYYGSDNERYLGASVAATLRSDIGPGIGLVTHWTKGFSLGVTWHGEHDDPFVYLSFDLFRFLQTEGPAFRAKYDRVRRLVDTL